MSKLVEVSVPLEAVGRVRCDFDGSFHVEVNGQEVDSDEKTYWQVIRARESHRAMELGNEVRQR